MLLVRRFAAAVLTLGAVLASSGTAAAGPINPPKPIPLIPAPASSQVTVTTTATTVTSEVTGLAAGSTVTLSLYFAPTSASSAAPTGAAAQTRTARAGSDGAAAVRISRISFAGNAGGVLAMSFRGTGADGHTPAVGTWQGPLPGADDEAAAAAPAATTTSLVRVVAPPAVLGIFLVLAGGTLLGRGLRRRRRRRRVS